ncbi:HCR022Cp [Eremothecium sinecaudum]|uniref:Phosphoacetylglucosamine mutase n=1 Tax=Eremothecium sinecaudum TaxID=45286 RepID=A0A0X8HRM4_9SACH|nr:HCR022Cp [Eremothecium sinecaudum]AMD20172.1 HCR022Cp [Eremothecium sinecaudum]
MTRDVEFGKLYDKHCITGIRYNYGTAGFRYKADLLGTVLFTTGLLAPLRSMYLKGQYIGVMITASHNPPEDNGVKLVDPKGEMLNQDWEVYATTLANAASEGKEQLSYALEELVKELGINRDIKANIIVARDSRESGPRLYEAFIDGTRVFENVKILNFNMLTTPQLHFLTLQCNIYDDVSKVNEELYYSYLLSAWASLADLYKIESSPFPLVIDTANGVGGAKARELFMRNKFFKDSLTIINDEWSKHDLLNSHCGADYVKTNQCLPTGIPISTPLNSIHCSYDGDADRVIFYYKDAQKNFHLLDGDKISTLFAKFFQHILPIAGIEESVRLGVVQTAYANGSSTRYLSEVLKVPVSCTPTGVKHLHREAVLKYDIGIYFEANGHGTVIFSNKLNETVKEKLADKTLSKDTTLALKTIKLFSKLINQTVGDAMSDMLAALAVLCILNWTPEQWDQEYSDLPNTLKKAIVPDRSVFKTTNAERQLVSPAGLQDQIDNIVKTYDGARLFVRASGTEDAVRIYAEASTKEQADELCNKVSELVIESTSASSQIPT